MPSRFSEYLYNESLSGNITNISSSWLSFNFSKLIKLPFSDWDAFKYGLIDESGNLIDSPLTEEEEQSIGLFENLVRKIKKTTNKYYTESDSIRFLGTLYLSESVQTTNLHEMRRDLCDELNNDEIMLLEKIIVLKGTENSD